MSESNVLRPVTADVFNCYVIGASCTGKSALVQAIALKKFVEVSL